MDEAKITLDKVALLGLNSLFGQISSLLLKQSSFIRKLVLYDENNIEKAKDIAIINSNCAVEAYVGKEKLNEAVKGADVIIIGDGSLSTPHTCFDLMAPRICDYAKAIANNSPNAIVLVAASPINILVPLLSECLMEEGTFDPKKIIGATAVDNARANSLLASILKVSPDKVTLPVVGGASRESKLPLISQAKPSTSLPLDVMKNLISDIRNFDNYIFAQKKIPEALNKAHATVQFVTSIFQGLRGDLNIVKIGFSKTSLIPETDYFSLPLQLGIYGIQKTYGLPELFSLEKELLTSSINAINNDVEIAKNFFRTMDSPVPIVNANMNIKMDDAEKEEEKSPVFIRSKGTSMNKLQSLTTLNADNEECKNKNKELGKSLEDNTKATNATKNTDLIKFLTSNKQDEKLPTFLGNSSNLKCSKLKDTVTISHTSSRKSLVKPSDNSNHQHESHDLFNGKLQDFERIGIKSSNENCKSSLHCGDSLQKEKSRNNMPEIKTQIHFKKGKYSIGNFSKNHENHLLNSLSVSNKKELLIENLFHELQNKKKQIGKYIQPVEKKMKNKFDILSAESKGFKEEIDKFSEDSKRNYISKKDLMESLIKKVANQTIEEEQNQKILNEKRIQSIIVKKLNEDEKENEDKLTNLLKLNKTLSEKKSKAIINKIDQMRTNFLIKDVTMSKIDTNGIKFSNSIKSPLNSLIEKNKTPTEWNSSQSEPSEKSLFQNEFKNPLNFLNPHEKHNFTNKIKGQLPPTSELKKPIQEGTLVTKRDFEKIVKDEIKSPVTLSNLSKSISDKKTVHLSLNMLEKNNSANVLKKSLNMPSEVKYYVSENKSISNMTQCNIPEQENCINEILPSTIKVDYTDKSKLINEVKRPKTLSDELMENIHESKMIPNRIEKNIFLSEFNNPIRPNNELNKIASCRMSKDSDETNKLINKIKRTSTSSNEPSMNIYESKPIPNLVAQCDVNEKRNLLNEVNTPIASNTELNTILPCSVNVNPNENSKLINEFKKPLISPCKQQQINVESKSIPNLVAKWDISGKNSLANEVKSSTQANEEIKITEQSISAKCTEKNRLIYDFMRPVALPSDLKNPINNNKPIPSRITMGDDIEKKSTANDINSSNPSFCKQNKPTDEMKCPMISTNDTIKSYLREAVERSKESKEEEMFFKFDTKEIQASELQKQSRSSTTETKDSHPPHYNDMWSLSKIMIEKKLRKTDSTQQKNGTKFNNKYIEDFDIEKNQIFFDAGLEKKYESYFKYRQFESNNKSEKSMIIVKKKAKSVERKTIPKKKIIPPVTTTPNTLLNEDFLGLAFCSCGQLEKINSINPNDFKAKPQEIKRKYNPNEKTEEQTKILDETSAEKTMHYLKRRNEIFKTYYGNKNNVVPDSKSNNDDTIDYLISDLFKEVHCDNALLEGNKNEISQNNNTELNENMSDKNNIELTKNINNIKAINNELFKNINNIKINNEELKKTINEINSELKSNGNEIESHTFELTTNKDKLKKNNVELQNNANEIKSHNFELMENKHSIENNNSETENNKNEMKFNNNRLKNTNQELRNKYNEINSINNHMESNKNEKNSTNDDEIKNEIENTNDYEFKSHKNEIMWPNFELQNTINKVENINNELPENKTTNKITHFGSDKIPSKLKCNYCDKNIGPRLLKRSDNNNQFPRKDPPKQLCTHVRGHSSSSGFESSLNEEQTSSSNSPEGSSTFFSSSNECIAECPLNQYNLTCQLPSSNKLKKADFENDSVFYKSSEKIDADSVEDDDKIFFEHIKDCDGEKSFNITNLINFETKENYEKNNILENNYDEKNVNRLGFSIELQSHNDENISHNSDDSKIIYKKYREAEPDIECEKEKNYQAFMLRMNKYDVFPCTGKENYSLFAFPAPNKKSTGNKNCPRLNEENTLSEASQNNIHQHHENFKGDLQNTKENAGVKEQESVKSEKSNIIFTKGSRKNIQMFSLKKSSLPQVEESNSKSLTTKALNSNYNNRDNIGLPYNIHNIIKLKKKVGDRRFNSLLKLRMNVKKTISKLQKMDRSDQTWNDKISFTHNSIHPNLNKNQQKAIKYKKYEHEGKAESYMVAPLEKNSVLSISKENCYREKYKKINKPAYYSTSSLYSRLMSPSRQAVNKIKEKALKVALFKKPIPVNKSSLLEGESDHKVKNKPDTLLNLIGKNFEKNQRINLDSKKKPPYGNEVISCFYKQKIPCQKDADDHYENTRCTFMRRAEEIKKEDSHKPIIPRKNKSLNLKKIRENYESVRKPHISQQCSSTIQSMLKSNMKVKINGTIPSASDSSSYYLFRKKFMKRNKTHNKEHFRPYSSDIQENFKGSRTLESIYKAFTKVTAQYEYSRGLKLPTLRTLQRNSNSINSSSK